MAKDFCKYHGKEPASWHCSSCGVFLCKPCLPANPHDRVTPRCPLCHDYIRYLGAANTAEPFWARMPSFFTYPFQVNALIFMACTAVIAAILPLHLVGVIIAVLLLAMNIRYLFAVIDRRSGGNTEAPGVFDVIGGGDSVFMRAVGLYFVYLAFVVMMAMRGPTSAFVGATLFALLLPASIMILAIHRSLQDAINPFVILSMISRLGLTYFAMFIITGIVSSGPA